MASRQIQIPDDEIDLREIFLVLWKARLPILAAVLLPAVVFFAYSYWVQPRSYEASAYVVLPNASASISNASTTVYTLPIPDVKSITQLATGPSLLGEVADDPRVVEKMGTGGNGALASAVAADIGKDHIKLSIRNADPETATLLVNVWAEKVVAVVDAAYRAGYSLDQKVLSAEQDYHQAQVEYESALKNSPVDGLTALLAQKQSDLSCWLAGIGRLERVLMDIKAQEQRLSGLPENSVISPEEGMALVMLAQNSLTSSVSCSTTPIKEDNILPQPVNNNDNINIEIPAQSQVILQMSGDTFSGMTIAQAVAGLQQSGDSLEAQIAGMQAVVAGLNDEIPSIKADLEMANTELEKYALSRDQFKNIYAGLLNQQQLIKTRGLNVASVSLSAVPPTQSMPRNTLINTAAVGFIGFILAATWFLARHWLWNK